MNKTNTNQEYDYNSAHIPICSDKKEFYLVSHTNWHDTFKFVYIRIFLSCFDFFIYYVDI